MDKKAIIILGFMLMLNLSVFPQVANNKKITSEIEKFLVEENFREASVLCTELLQTSSEKSEYQFYNGISKLGLSKYSEAEESFSLIIAKYEKSKSVEDYTLPAFYYRAKTYHKLYMFDQEIDDYNSLLNIGVDKKMKALVDNSIKSATNAKEIFNNFAPLVVTRLAILNSEYDDHTPILSHDGMKLFFTSKRPGGIGNDAISPENKYYEDIWLWDKNKGLMSKPFNIGNIVNTAEHDATCGLSPDGNTLFIFKEGKKIRGDIWTSTFVDSAWTEPVKLPKVINQKKSAERHASITPDGKTLYFSSDRKDGVGGRDIWISIKNDEGEWQKPTNFQFNTEFDEEAPIYLADSKTLYFSSKGFKNMGGFDIFKTIMQDDGSWSEPVNIGFPINTVEDDVFYFPMGNEKIAYYTRRDGQKADIYKSFMWGESDDVLIVEGVIYENKSYTNKYEIQEQRGDSLYSQNDELYIKNTIISEDSVAYVFEQDNSIIDSVYFVPENETLSIFDLENYKYTDVFETNSLKGDYKFVMLPKRDAKIVYRADSYLFDTKNVFFGKEYPGKRIKYNAELVKIEQGETEKFKNVNYTENSDEINTFTKKELELVAEYMNKYPELVVSFSANDYLVEDEEIDSKRKQTAIKFIKEKGINENRIYTDLSPRLIADNQLEYTIYDELSVQKAIAEKKNRTEEQQIVAQTQEITIELENIYFDFDKKNLIISSNTGLDKLADYMLKNPNSKFEIVGYTDAVGSESYNLKLSKRRALTVKKYLSNKGISDVQLTVVGAGESNPITKNKKDGAWFEDSKKYNRRVKINVINQGEPKVKVIQFQNIPQEYKTQE